MVVAVVVVVVVVLLLLLLLLVCSSVLVLVSALGVVIVVLPVSTKHADDGVVRDQCLNFSLELMLGGNHCCRCLCVCRSLICIAQTYALFCPLPHVDIYSDHSILVSHSDIGAYDSCSQSKKASKSRIEQDRVERSPQYGDFL